MIRSSFAAKGLGISLLVLGSFACGDTPPAKQPETTPVSTDGGADMPHDTSADTHDAGATTAAAEPPPAPTPPPSLALPTAAAKLKFKEKKAFDLEVKSDGAVHSGGKPFAKISGQELQDKDGKSQLKVDSDGTITTHEGAAYAKFEGDDLVSLTSTKYSIGDDGALTSTNDKGTKANLGKLEGVGSAKRSALLTVAFAMWGTKAPAPAAAKATATPAAKAGDKAATPAKATPAKKP